MSTGSKVVKVFNHEADCVAEFEALNDDMRDKQFKAQIEEIERIILSKN